jgi:hypothetical protein
MTFDAAVNGSAPASYTEGGIQVKSILAGGGHIHFSDINGDGSVELFNHSSPGSEIYQFSRTGGGTFSLEEMDLISTTAGQAGHWTSSAGGDVFLSGNNQHVVFGSAFENVTSVTWDLGHTTAINQYVDNLIFM